VQRGVRTSGTFIQLAWLPMLLGGAALVVLFFTDEGQAPPIEPPPRPTRRAPPPAKTTIAPPPPVHEPTPPADPPLEVLAQRVSDASRTPEERLVDLRELGRRSETAGPFLFVLATLSSDDPQAAQVRVNALSALVQYPDDPRAQDRLARALAPDAPRVERVLAISLVEQLGLPAWARPHLEALLEDQDPGVRDKARRTLERMDAPGDDATPPRDE
jgi:hypothetical protein